MKRKQWAVTVAPASFSSKQHECSLLEKRSDLPSPGDRVWMNWVRPGKSDPYWVSWGTKLDDTNLVLLPTRSLPDIGITLWQEIWLCNQHTMGICVSTWLGFILKEQPFGPFWHDSFTEKNWDMLNLACHAFVHLPSACKMIFLRPLTDDWIKSYHDSNSYLTTHSCIVKRVGELMDVDMDDHDLSKSRIVQIALGIPMALAPVLERWMISYLIWRNSPWMLFMQDTGGGNHHPEHEAVGDWLMLMFANSLQTDFRCTCKRMFMMEKKAGGSISILFPTISGWMVMFWQTIPHSWSVWSHQVSHQTKNIFHNLGTLQLLNIFIR